jgi:uncharacterized protein YyaL (SSP411 family)
MSTQSHPSRNRLAGETSPYLLQHADNPVDWWPWGEEALALARREDKPILLSIGYSACHWCHVMAHESFEDESSAARMNELFINIKVDREERPDLDKAYQLAHQLLARRPGGWPLTVFLNPHNLTPFFAGTYFPKTPRYDLPGFASLLKQVADWYRHNKDALAQNDRALLNALDSLSESENSAEWPDAAVIDLALNELREDFDADRGGFGGAPKFPHVGVLEFLMGSDRAEAREMGLFTLRKMAWGGIYDQIGGGFCRYAVDADWTIPHFEKMLYDNGPLLGLYALAWQATGEPLFRRVAIETAEWALREMRAPEGGFCSSLDADSEGEEGKFYVWSRGEIQSALSADETALLAFHYGLDRPANFEGRWHLRIVQPLEAVARTLSITTDEAERRLLGARGKLRQARAGRTRPGRDDKVLTAWNALMIKGLARAGRLLERQEFVDAAREAFDFLFDRLWIDDRLLASWKDGRARFAAYLDDYAFLLDAALELLQGYWSAAGLDRACALAEGLLARFEDKQRGGFFFTAHDHERLIHRAKPMQDESMTSGNAIAAQALLRLGYLLGEERYLTSAANVLRGSALPMRRYPAAHGGLLAAVDTWLRPPRVVVLRGESGELEAWRRCALSVLTSRDLCLSVPADAADLPGALAQRKPSGRAVAYVCEGSRCLPPKQSLTEFRALLES